MNTVRFHILLLALLLVTATEVHARRLRIWSYTELTVAADVVVIAKPLSNTETSDLFGDTRGYIGVNTEFQVNDVIKGNVGAERFIVLHFRHAPNIPSADGMMTIFFRLEGLIISGDSFILKEGQPITFVGKGTTQTPPPEYLLFLKKRIDGRYEPVTGQMDSMLSVREVDQPLLLMQ